MQKWVQIDNTYQFHTLHQDLKSNLVTHGQTISLAISLWDDKENSNTASSLYSVELFMRFQFTCHSAQHEAVLCSKAINLTHNVG